MRGLARVVLMGNLTQDPESFSAGCRFGVAVNERVKKDDEWVDRVSFYQVTVFGKQADTAMEYLAKGRGVAIDGRLRQDRWTTEGGDNRQAVKVIAESVMFLPSGEKRDDSGGGRFEPMQDSEPSGPPDDSEIPF